MNAKEAYETAKSAYEVKRAKQLTFILEQIELRAREGEFSYTAHQLYPENKNVLEKLGYTISIGHNMITDNMVYIIEWRNA